ncbi:SMC-Scp complex subunit ScpB [Brucellaceae bacterium C25G]
MSDLADNQQPEILSASEAAERMTFDEAVRKAEAIIFASAQPVSFAALSARIPNVSLDKVLERLQHDYRMRGVNLVRRGDAWCFRTAPDLSHLMSREVVQQRKLSRAALEVLAIIAYHQPVTRAELEDIRGVETSKGTLDVLMETGWIKLRGRRRTPGRPVTYGTTEAFLDHFGLSDMRDLPGHEELRGAGLLSGRVPADFKITPPDIDIDELTMDEAPLDDINVEDMGLLTPLNNED